MAVTLKLEQKQTANTAGDHRGWVWSIFARLEFGAAKTGLAAVVATALRDEHETDTNLLEMPLLTLCPKGRDKSTIIRLWPGSD